MERTHIIDMLNDYDVEIDYKQFCVIPVGMTTEKLIRQQRINVGRAAELYKRIKDADGSEEDRFSAWCYMKVCVDAVKHWLDMKKAYMVLDIKELMNKYPTR